MYSLDVIKLKGKVYADGKTFHLEDRIEYGSNTIQLKDIVSYEKHKDSIKSYTKSTYGKKQNYRVTKPIIKFELINGSSMVFSFDNESRRNDYFDVIDRYMKIKKAIDSVVGGALKTALEIDDEQKDKNVKKKRDVFNLEKPKDWIKNYMFPGKDLPGFKHEEILLGDVYKYFETKFIMDSKAVLKFYLNKKDEYVQTKNMKDKNVVNIMKELGFISDSSKYKDRVLSDMSLEIKLSNLFGGSKYINGKNKVSYVIVEMVPQNIDIKLVYIPESKSWFVGVFNHETKQLKSDIYGKSGNYFHYLYSTDLN